MKRFCLSALITISSLVGLAQNTSLISWKIGSCDPAADITRIVNRISAIELNGDILNLTIGFRANCCAQYNPGVRFTNDTMHIESFVEDGKTERSICVCACLRSLSLVITGINDTSMVIMFDGKRIFFSPEQYKVYPVEFQLLNGDTINRKNKYGRKEGIWITNFANGHRKSEEYFIDEPGKRWQASQWSKSYYEHGVMESYARKDTIERWHDDGKTAYTQFTSYADSDKIVLTTEYFPSGQINTRKQERHLTQEHIIKDSCGSFRSSIWEIYETYYENGSREIQKRGDTIWTWYQNGKVQRLEYDRRVIEYDTAGNVILTASYWNMRPSPSYCLSFSLEEKFYSTGQRASIIFLRDEVNDHGISPRVRYLWKWDESGKLITAPPNWQGPLPEAS